MEKILPYFGKSTKVACDEKCNKAWGANNRPRIRLSEDNEDDYAFLADDELGEAPEDPGTYEGGHAKPSDKSEIPNKWCVRECERCVMSDIGNPQQELVLPDFSKRRYNLLWKNNPLYTTGNNH